MARLIVSAVSAESTLSGTNGTNLYVSVTRATDGKPVTGLTMANFRASMEGEDLIINGLGETKIPFNGGEKVGFYFLETAFADGTEKWSAGESYAFGVQVRRLKGKRVVDSGQTITNVTKFKVV